MLRIVAIVALLLLVTAPVVAQFRDGERNRDGDRNRDGRDGDRRDGERRDRGGFDPKQWIEGMDANKNGIIEPGELSERSARFLQRAADQAGLKAGEPWPVDKLLTAVSSRRDENSSSNDNSNRPSEARTETPAAAPTTSAATSKIPVLGFGEKDGGIKIPTFSPAPLGGVQPIASSANTTQYDERTVSRVNDMLKEADTNRNGYLDPDEIKAYRNWSTPPEESDLDKDGRLSRSELLERIAKRFGSRSSSRPEGSSRGSDNQAAQQVDAAAQSRKYAEGLMQKYDANKSGYLEKDEWKEMKPEYQSADANKDGVIAVDELVAKLNSLNSGQTGAGATAGSSGGPPASSGKYGRDKDRGGKPGEKDAKKPTVRALTPTERLPKGLPDWFLRNDADADGQVGMAEYAAAWSERTASEFQKYDLNGDGFITAAECLTVDKDSKKK